MIDTVEDLIQQVRDITDEDNVEDISDEFIVRMLNRAQQDLVSEITRKYNPQYMSEVILTASDFTSDVSGVNRIADLSKYIQSVAFKINSVESKIGQAWVPVRQVPFSHTLALDIETATSLPVVYSTQGSKIFVYPNIDSLVSLRIRYQMRPPKLTSVIGRITDLVGPTSFKISNSAMLQDIGNEDLSNFVNVIDPFTGNIKGTYQVTLSADNETVVIATENLYREKVFGYTVSTSLVEISDDDLVCSAKGTCVPYLVTDLTNYHVEIAAFHVKRALGTVDNPDYQERDRIIERVSKLWAGREHLLKINRTRKYPLYSWQSFFRGS